MHDGLRADANHTKGSDKVVLLDRVTSQGRRRFKTDPTEAGALEPIVTRTEQRLTCER